MTRTTQDSPPREAAPGKKWMKAPVIVDGNNSTAVDALIIGSGEDR